MSASSDAVAALGVECRRLREKLDRLRQEKERLERALMLSHQLQQECYEGWLEQQHQVKLLRDRLADAEAWRDVQEAAAEMGHTIRFDGERKEGRP